MLLSHDVAWLRRKLRAKLAAPGPVFKCFSRPCRLLNRRDVLPALIIARTVAMVHRIEDPHPCLSRSGQQLQLMRDAITCFRNSFDAIPNLATLRNEIVVGID